MTVQTENVLYALILLLWNVFYTFRRRWTHAFIKIIFGPEPLIGNGKHISRLWSWNWRYDCIARCVYFTSKLKFLIGNFNLPDIFSPTSGSRPRISPDVLLTTGTPQLTPPGSPPLRLSASISPINLSNPVSPRQHSVSFSTSGCMMEDDASSVFSHTSYRSSVSGVETGNPAGM